MFVFSLLMLGVLLNSADAQGTPGDQKKVERERRDTDNILDGLRRALALVGSHGHGKHAVGSTYIRWGRTVCPKGRETLYTGFTAGSHYGHPGGGSSYICLKSKPEWGKYKDGFQSNGYIYGTEYHIFANNPFSKSLKSLHHHDAPCAACYTPKSATIMIPAGNTCPNGWDKEYGGYVMAEGYAHKGRTTYVCVDEDPEVRAGSGQNKAGALLFNTEAQCGSLPCPPYVAGRELTCVVCSK